MTMFSRINHIVVNKKGGLLKAILFTSLFVTKRKGSLKSLAWDRATLTPTLRHWTFPSQMKKNNFQLKLGIRPNSKNKLILTAAVWGTIDHWVLFN